MKLGKAVGLALIFAAVPALANMNTTDLSDNSLIVGGTEVSAGDPVASSTVLITDGQYICTGSIIDQDIVVTAAHCVAAKAQDLRVIFTVNVADATKADVRGITGYVANPKWKGDASHGVDQGDIALMRIDGDLPDGYQPATLLSAADSKNLSQGDDALLAGFGITKAKTQQGAGVLRKVDVKVESQLGKTEVVLDQTDDKGACHGDSGGPAFAQSADGQLLLWGVTNRGYPDNAPDDCVHEVVYTRIQAYANWIKKTEAKLRAEAGSQ